MQILVLGDDGPDLAAIKNAVRLGKFEVLATRNPPRPARTDSGRYRFAGWTLDAARRDLAGDGGRRAVLTSSEFDLLVAFLQRPGEALSRDDLLRALRGRAWDYLDRSIDTLVARLRKKIDALEGPSLLRSVRGVGYVFCAAVAREDGERH
jgi:two-component system OmpR family response regulator